MRFRVTTKHAMFVAERLAGRGSGRVNLKVRDPRRPYTISLNLGRYAPNRRRSF